MITTASSASSGTWLLGMCMEKTVACYHKDPLVLTKVRDVIDVIAVPGVLLSNACSVLSSKVDGRSHRRLISAWIGLGIKYWFGLGTARKYKHQNFPQSDEAGADCLLVHICTVRYETSNYV